jgi:hypothetical protein
MTIPLLSPLRKQGSNQEGPAGWIPAPVSSTGQVSWERQLCAKKLRVLHHANFGIQGVKYSEDFLINGNVTHGIGVMHHGELAFFVYHGKRG